MHGTARFVAVILLGCSTFFQASPLAAQGQEIRRDNEFGTFHENMRIESGPGEDTVISVTPPPDLREEQDGNSQQSYPIIVAPQVNMPPYGHRPPRTPGQ
ncbi:hypothetical protein [Megalodesulfovibrio paquesii]